MLEKNHYLSTYVGLMKEWRTRDVGAYSQLVDFTAVERERDRRKAQGLARPSYTAFVIDSVARALRQHPKLNRIVYRGLTGYRWVQFEQVDVSVAVEVVDGDLDIAYASIIRNADQIGLDGITEALVRLAEAPTDDRQLKRLRRFPAGLAVLLARATGLHPKLWVRFRGGSCAVTSPAKYGIESVSAKSCWPLEFAFGRVRERPMVVDGSCVPRQSAMLSLCFHRELTTGAVAARFFEQVVQHLEQGWDGCSSSDVAADASESVSRVPC
jgi:pyruvate/2-oxoglutarate dehydrogenase complex dihydrolipoamide acyltransferase (E2) component